MQNFFMSTSTRHINGVRLWLNLFLNLALGEASGQLHVPAAILQRTKLGTHCTGGK